MNYTQETFSILETMQGTAGGDVTLTNAVLQVTGTRAMKYADITRSIYGTTEVIVAVAEVSQVTTVTPTASTPAVGTIYALSITQKLANGTMANARLSYTVQATADSATTVCNAWRSQLSAYTNIEITASGTTTLILTADAGAPVFTVSENSASIAATNGTLGVYAVGTPTAIYQSNPLVSGLVAGSVYSTIPFIFSNTDTVSGEQAQVGVYKHTVYANQGGTNYTPFVTRLNYALEGVTGASGTIDTEAFEIGS